MNTWDNTELDAGNRVLLRAFKTMQDQGCGQDHEGSCSNGHTEDEVVDWIMANLTEIEQNVVFAPPRSA